MVMNGFNTNFDAEGNQVYGVNTVAFHYVNEPIQVERGEPVRIYLANLLEFDPINSFHIHANFFNYFPTGTSLTPVEFTDTVIQGQAQRGILELEFPYAGEYMFHAHKTEFAELGWMGFFDVGGAGDRKRRPVAFRSSLEPGGEHLMEAAGRTERRGGRRSDLGAGRRAAAADRGGDRDLCRPRRPRARRAAWPAGRGARGRAHRSASRRDRAHACATRAPTRSRSRRWRSTTPTSTSPPTPMARSGGSARRPSSSITRGRRAPPTRSRC